MRFFLFTSYQKSFVIHGAEIRQHNKKMKIITNLREQISHG